MKKADILKVQEIGSLVCEECVTSDCGVDPNKCQRIEDAVSALYKTPADEDLPPNSTGEGD